MSQITEVKQRVRSMLQVLPPAQKKAAVKELKAYLTKISAGVPARKLGQLQRRIASGKYWIPKVGDLVYTHTRISIDHGWDDVRGGLSTVSRVYKQMSGGDPECVFIEIEEHSRGTNWTQFAFPDQKKLQKEFGTQFAYADPDNG